ncbi:MAG: TIM barrel protein [Pseudomonadota bacterium]
MTAPTPGASEPRFKYSFAQYALHRKIGSGGPLWRRHAKRLHFALTERFSDFFQTPLQPLYFPEFVRETFDIGAVEYVSTFYRGLGEDMAYWTEMKKRADGAGVESVLIMVDGEGAIGDPNTDVRKQTALNHRKWVDIAAFLGCHAIRVIAETDNALPFEEQHKLVLDGLNQLADYSTKQNINLVIENKGGYSQHGAWLAELMHKANSPHIGTLPDFGNFTLPDGTKYDGVKGVEELIPYAQGVSVKAFGFDAEGNENTLDFEGMMKVVIESDFRGFLGLEFEGSGMNEIDGTIATRALVDRLIEKYSPAPAGAA